MDLKLSGKRAIVAASTKGLGFATARALLAEGCTIVINGRDAATLSEAATRLPGAIPVVGDVSSPQGASAFIDAAVDALGGIDILITNAGGPPVGNFASTPLASYAPAIDLNLMSIVAMCQRAVPRMQAQGWGRIVAITSYSVRQPIANLILSNTARAGATAFLKTLALEIAGDGITVNSVQPGLHTTQRLTSIYGDDLANAAQTVPTGVLGDPDDFGAIVTFLCSDQAKFVTGSALAVEGGAYKGLL